MSDHERPRKGINFRLKFGVGNKFFDKLLICDIKNVIVGLTI